MSLLDTLLLDPIRWAIQLPAMGPLRQLANAGSFEQAVQLVSDLIMDVVCWRAGV